MRYQGFEPIQQIRSFEQNKKTLVFERLRICYLNMAGDRRRISTCGRWTWTGSAVEGISGIVQLG